jgi:hypothetical protein
VLSDTDGAVGRDTGGAVGRNRKRTVENIEEIDLS